MCEDCGNTTPVPNEICSSCGGRMIALNSSKADSVDDEISGINSPDSESDVEPEDHESSFAEESLERLQEEEAAEDEQEPYGYNNADDE